MAMTFQLVYMRLSFYVSIHAPIFESDSVLQKRILLSQCRVVDLRQISEAWALQNVYDLAYSTWPTWLFWKVFYSKCQLHENEIKQMKKAYNNR